jgi:small subunit ribosomal protein S13
MKRVIKNPFLKDIVQVYGLGTTTHHKLLKSTGINLRKETYVLSSTIKSTLENKLVDALTGKTLTAIHKEYLEFQQKIKNYRGLRTRYGYPCRGQRTHTNANTKKKF